MSPNKIHPPHQLKLCTLSGNSEVGRNCNFLEYKDEIIIVDMGLSFPEQELYGIDYLIPNYSYLEKNKKKISGILITHGHLDHTGALPYILPRLDFPDIYAGEFAIELIKQRLSEFKLLDRVKLKKVNNNQTINFKNSSAKFIGVTHSIPNSFAIFINSKAGNIFFSGDYKIDPHPAVTHRTDFESLKQLQGQIDLALLESTNASQTGQSVSEKEVGETLIDLIKSAPGRVIVSAFSSQVTRLALTLEIAHQLNRKVIISGRSLVNAFGIAKDLGYIDIPDNTILREQQINSVADNQLLILCTGSQGERYGALNRISLNSHRFIKIKNNDRVILSSSEIPGNEIQIGRMTDRLIKQGAELITSKLDTVHASGHGSQKDMQTMLDLIKPKQAIPVHGTMTMRYMNKLNLVRWGMKDANVHLTDDGQVWKLINRRVQRGNQIPSKPILVDGTGVSDIGEIVLRDRKQLAEYGFMVIILNLSSRKKHIIGSIKYASRGFIYMNNSKQLLNKLDQKIRSVHGNWLNQSKQQQKFSLAELEQQITATAEKFLYQETKRDPVILVEFV